MTALYCVTGISLVVVGAIVLSAHLSYREYMKSKDKNDF